VSKYCCADRNDGWEKAPFWSPRIDKFAALSAVENWLFAASSGDRWFV